MLAPLRPDLIISGGFPWRIPSEVLALPRLGAINMHPALLPRYRGPAAIEWALRNGDAELGFTVHRLSPTSIPARSWRRRASRSPTTTTSTRLWPSSVPCSQTSSGKRSSGWHEADPGRVQDEAEATHPACSMRSGGSSTGQPARTIHNQVRSWIRVRDIPLGAFGEVDGETLQITDSPGSERVHGARASAARHGSAARRRASGRAMWRRTNRGSQVVPCVMPCR